VNEQGLIRLREFLFKEFNEEQLAALSQELGLIYDKLPGEGAFGKTRGLIEAAQARDLIPTLMSRVRDLRPAAYRIAAIRRPGGHVAPLAQPSASEASGPVPAIPPAQPSAFAASAPASVTPISRLHVRPLLIVLIIVACLVTATGAGALNQWMLNQRGGVPIEGIAAVTAIASPTPGVTARAAATDSQTETPASPMETVAVQTTAAMQTAETSLPTLPPTATPAQTVTPQPTATPERTTPTPIPTATSTPTASASATAPISTPAVQAVIEANELLAAFYSGRVNGDALKTIWVGDTYLLVIAYPTKTLKRNLGVDVKPGEGLTATLRYIRLPSIVSDNGSRIVLSSREYWTYKTRDLIACETIDYSYTAAKSAERYQIVAYKGDVMSAGTAGACE
jgi:hypothetical protein